ncbi:TipC family immunity protein [Clostridium sp. E02]|uniref:TipC family immunity protein n=1 Tax=Clostridium sp. E02 TaxID=2487134 RepID=UPI000F51C38C|nr:TipC family immunity protein [Clostridium sp. E02]
MIKKKLVYFGGGILLLFLIVVSYKYLSKEGNVMDEIYKAATRKEALEIFNQVPELEEVSYENLSEFENFGGLRIPYRQECLKSGFKVKLYFPKEGDKIQIKSNIELNDTTKVIIYMSYDYKKRNMTLEPIHISYWPTEGEMGTHFYDSETVYGFLEKQEIGEQDIKEYQNYILYDVVVKTWAVAHGEDYEQARKKMENCTFVDNTFLFPENETSSVE